MGKPLSKWREPLTMWSHEVTWTISNDISISTKSIVSKLDQVVVYNKGPPPTVSYHALDTWPGYHVGNGKRYISSSVRYMATKLDRVVTSDEGLLSTKSHSLLITSSHEIIWRIKNVLSSLSWDLWPSSLARW